MSYQYTGTFKSDGTTNPSNASYSNYDFGRLDQKGTTTDGTWGQTAQDLLRGLSEGVNEAILSTTSMANDNTAKTFDFNHNEAQLAREWQTEMSNTAHQREVQDLKAAGLNPVLSANNGAQSYTTSSASAQADSSGISAIPSMVGSLINGAVGLLQARMTSEATIHSADRAAEASEYAAEKSYEAQYNSAYWNYQAAMDKPATNIYSLLDKYFGNSGLGSDLVTKIREGVSGMFTGTTKYVKNGKLTKSGKSYVGYQLQRLSIPNTANNRKIYKEAFIDGNKAAVGKFNKLVRAYNKGTSIR